MFSYLSDFPDEEALDDDGLCELDEDELRLRSDDEDELRLRSEEDAELCDRLDDEEDERLWSSRSLSRLLS